MEPIAIIGMGCRFPGAGDCDALWRVLRHGIDVIGEKQLPKEVTLPPALQEVAMKGNGGGGETLNLDDQERETILKALAQAHGHLRRVAPQHAVPARDAAR